MSTEKKNLPASADGVECLSGEVVDAESNSDAVWQAAKEGIEALNALAGTAKTEAAIAKKEVDNSVNATKTYIAKEGAFFDSIMKDLERKDITPEERAEDLKMLEASTVRLKNTEESARRMAEESPFRKKTNYAIVIGLAAVFYFGVKYYKKMAK